MIRFNCVYCGKPISVEGKLIGEKIECSGCGHSVMVRRKQSDDTQKSSVERDINTELNDANFLEEKNNQQIANWLNPQNVNQGRRKNLAARRELSLSMARFDDLTLFSLSFAFVLLLWMNHGEMKVNLTVLLLLSRFGLFLSLAMLGMVLSLISIFVRHEKYEFEKWLMLLFALLVTTGTGVYSGIVMLEEGISWLIIFPLWNIFNSIILLCAFDVGLLNTNSITNERASLLQVVVSIAMITLLLILCERVFNLHWAISYSIAVSYTMSLHGAIQDIFGKRVTSS